ncbi:acyltransferase family protein, partial [Singulisphaera rosea]
MSLPSVAHRAKVSPCRPGSRVDELDFLRGVGALAILSYHIWPRTFFFGWSRVELFFVISGYLITSIVLRHGEREGFLFKFYARRALRTWPAYFAVVGIVLLLRPGLWQELRVEIVFAYLTFSQNVMYYGVESPSIHWPPLAHLWCLSIEEHFYLIWPPLLMLLRGAPLVPLLIGIMANSVILRALGVHPWTLAARSDGLALGALLAVVLRDGEWVRDRLRTLRTGF